MSTYIITVKGQTYKNRHKLRRMGYSWNDERNLYEKAFSKYPPKREFRKANMLYGVNVEIEDTSQYRSKYYRKDFLNAQKWIKETVYGERIYRCVYCGRKIPEYKMQVDHLYPVKEAVVSKRVRNKLRKRGIVNVNQVENLVPACEYCNKKKGSQMGLWIVKGILGQSETYWLLRKIYERS